MDKTSPTPEMKKAALDGFKVQLDYWFGNHASSDKTFVELNLTVPFTDLVLVLFRAYKEEYRVHSRRHVDIDEIVHFADDVVYEYYEIESAGNETEADYIYESRKLTSEQAYEAMLEMCQKYVSEL